MQFLGLLLVSGMIPLTRKNIAYYGCLVKAGGEGARICMNACIVGCLIIYNNTQSGTPEHGRQMYN